MPKFITVSQRIYIDSNTTPNYLVRCVNLQHIVNYYKLASYTSAVYGIISADEYKRLEFLNKYGAETVIELSTGEVLYVDDLIDLSVTS